MKHQNFIDRDKLYGMLQNNAPTESQLNDILNKARKLKGLNLEDVAKLLSALSLAGPQDLIYIGGSTFVVTEAITYFDNLQ